jgi:hypothetical protein
MSADQSPVPAESCADRTLEEVARLLNSTTGEKQTASFEVALDEHGRRNRLCEIEVSGSGDEFVVVVRLDDQGLLLGIGNALVEQYGLGYMHMPGRLRKTIRAQPATQEACTT